MATGSGISTFPLDALVYKMENLFFYAADPNLRSNILHISDRQNK